MRGEVALKLGEETFLLRPSFAALVAAEQETGSLVAMLERAGAGELRLSEIAALFWHCILDPGLERAAFQELLVAHGLGGLLPTYRTLLAAVFNPS